MKTVRKRKGLLVCLLCTIAAFGFRYRVIRGRVIVGLVGLVKSKIKIIAREKEQTINEERKMDVEKKDELTTPQLRYHSLELLTSAVPDYSGRGAGSHDQIFSIENFENFFFRFFSFFFLQYSTSFKMESTPSNSEVLHDMTSKD